MSEDSVTTTIAGRALHSPVLSQPVCRCFSARRRLSVEAEAYTYIEVEALFSGHLCCRPKSLPPQITGAVAQTTDKGY